MKKQNIATIAAKNRIFNKIILTLISRENFLIMGHKNADEDCIASMVAISLLVKKLGKSVSILLTEQVNEKFLYLLNICRYNAINIIPNCSSVLDEIDAVCVVDTPKPAMLQTCGGAENLRSDPKVAVIEFDHHLAADSAYIGDEGLCLVSEASSTCELIGYLSLKMQQKRSVLELFDVDDLFTRNFVLAVLTGIVGDSKMGRFLKSRREEWFYQLFSGTFSQMLADKTTANSKNLSSMQEVFREITRLSKIEEHCFNYFMDHKERNGALVYASLPEKKTDPLPEEFDLDLFVSTARSVTDALAEESGSLGMVVYYDPPDVSDLVQFRIRRSHTFRDLDLRTILDEADIENGGGHEGAIGFRIPRSTIADLSAYLNDLCLLVSRLID